MKLAIAIAATALTLSSLSAHAAEVNLTNQSSWDIHEIYFAPASQTNWGEDHLGNQVLSQGEVLELSGVTPGKWDLRIVDEDGDECILHEISIKGADGWTITDEDLLACQEATE